MLVFGVNICPCTGQIINLRVPNFLYATELANSEITNREVIFGTETFHSAAGRDDFPPERSSRRSPQAPRQCCRRPGGGSGGQRAAPSGTSAAPGALCPRNSSQLKNRCVIFLLLTGQPCTVKTRRRLDWEFWLYVLCKPKYGTHKPCSDGARHPCQ